MPATQTTHNINRFLRIGIGTPQHSTSVRRVQEAAAVVHDQVAAGIFTGQVTGTSTGAGMVDLWLTESVVVVAVEWR